VNNANTKELLDGYVAYATPGDLAADALEAERAGHVGTSVSLTVTLSVSYSWSWTWT